MSPVSISDKTSYCKISQDIEIGPRYSYTVRETKFLEHSPENRCPLYVLYKISLAQANFPLAQLKMHLHWWAGQC